MNCICYEDVAKEGISTMFMVTLPWIVYSGLKRMHGLLKYSAVFVMIK